MEYKSNGLRVGDATAVGTIMVKVSGSCVPPSMFYHDNGDMLIAAQSIVCGQLISSDCRLKQMRYKAAIG